MTPKLSRMRVAGPRLRMLPTTIVTRIPLVSNNRISVHRVTRSAVTLLCNLGVPGENNRFPARLDLDKIASATGNTLNIATRSCTTVFTSTAQHNGIVWVFNPSSVWVAFSQYFAASGFWSVGRMRRDTFQVQSQLAPLTTSMYTPLAVSDTEVVYFLQSDRTIRRYPEHVLVATIPVTPLEHGIKYHARKQLLAFATSSSVYVGPLAGPWSTIPRPSGTIRSLCWHFSGTALWIHTGPPHVLYLWRLTGTAVAQYPWAADTYVVWDDMRGWS